MKELVIYLLESLVCGGIFLGAYALLLDRRADFGLCRACLLLAVVLTALIPALDIPVWNGKVVYVTAAEASEISGEPEAAAETFGNLSAAVPVVYAAGVLLMLAGMARQLLKIRRLRRTAVVERTGDLDLVRVDGAIASFSFFRSVYVSAGVPPEDLRVILAHEAGHIRHRHSRDRVAMELCKALLWWNPFVWIAARRLTEVQEYEADRDVLESGCAVPDYVNTLLRHLFGYSPDIANGLRGSLTKKRLAMIASPAVFRNGALRKAAMLSVTAALMLCFSCTVRAVRIVHPSEDAVPTSAEEEIRIRKDAAKPLVYLDGKRYDGDFDRIDPNTIQAVTVYKNDAAVERYGAGAENGVIVIRTR